jgi:2-iminobutanoate/2-iminopropanoate deaminase
MTQLKRIEAQEAPKAIGPYSQAVSDGRYLYVSGQLAFDPTTGKLINGDIQQQTKQVLKNIEAILKAGGASFKSVLRTEVFLKDLKDFKLMNEEYATHFTKDAYPARYTIGCELVAGALVEIACVALIEKT